MVGSGPDAPSWEGSGTAMQSAPEFTFFSPASLSGLLICAPQLLGNTQRSAIDNPQQQFCHLATTW
jgi:hypothetical protein